MISRNFTTQFTAKRMVWSGSSSSLTNISSFKGHLQQTSSELAQSLGLTFTKSFTIFCAIATDIKAGDEISDGVNTYTVEAIQELLVGANKHKQIFVERKESYG